MRCAPLEPAERGVAGIVIVGSVGHTTDGSDDAVGVTERGVRLQAKVPENDRRAITGVAHAPDERVVAGHAGLGESAPRLPVAVLAQLVQEDEVCALATSGTSRRRLDSVLPAVGELQPLRAVRVPDVLDLGGEFGVALRQVDAHRPGVLGLLEVLGRAERQVDAQHVQEEQRQNAAHRGLAVLASDLDHHGLVAQVPRRLDVTDYLERVDEEPSLPGEQADA